jgi:hypothetical protein
MKLIHNCAFAIFSANVLINPLILLAQLNRLPIQLQKGLKIYIRNILRLSNKLYNTLKIPENWQIRFTLIALVMEIRDQMMAIITLGEAIYNSREGTTTPNLQILSVI